jgi:hypothetical protein
MSYLQRYNQMEMYILFIHYWVDINVLLMKGTVVIM